MVLLVQRHGVVVKRRSSVPRSCDRSLFPVDDDYLPRFREVYIALCTAFLKLKRFRVRVEFNFARFVALTVYIAQTAASVTDISSLTTSIVAKIICIVSVVDGFQKCIRCSVENADASVLRVSHIQPIIRRNV